MLLSSVCSRCRFPKHSILSPSPSVTAESESSSGMSEISTDPTVLPGFYCRMCTASSRTLLSACMACSDSKRRVCDCCSVALVICPTSTTAGVGMLRDQLATDDGLEMQCVGTPPPDLDWDALTDAIMAVSPITEASDYSSHQSAFGGIATPTSGSTSVSIMPPTAYSTFPLLDTCAALGLGRAVRRCERVQSGADTDTGYELKPDASSYTDMSEDGSLTLKALWESSAVWVPYLSSTSAFCPLHLAWSIIADYLVLHC
ncbi:hypothetical protein DFH11DRAFT_1156293 [Phellopilus nigrolimitatus]|nr:hypothetical protein DFH11DRAFT_1156293 [Phellopilus nigrolimitatus]